MRIDLHIVRFLVLKILKLSYQNENDSKESENVMLAAVFPGFIYLN